MKNSKKTLASPQDVLSSSEKILQGLQLGSQSPNRSSQINRGSNSLSELLKWSLRLSLLLSGADAQTNQTTENNTTDNTLSTSASTTTNPPDTTSDVFSKYSYLIYGGMFLCIVCWCAIYCATKYRDKRNAGYRRMKPGDVDSDPRVIEVELQEKEGDDEKKKNDVVQEKERVFLPGL